MKPTIAAVMAAGLAALAVGSAAQTPPDHPPVSPLPPGHPPLTQPPAAADADPADVGSVEGIVEAYYDSVSGPAGEPREWGRFLSLFSPAARLSTARAAGPSGEPLVLDPAQFVAANRRYFERGGYFETQILHEPKTFGSIAHVFSTFESRRRADGPAYARGINSLQLVRSGDRWWIVSVVWDHERKETQPIPPAMLPDEDANG
jgi:hypothetical protein